MEPESLAQPPEPEAAASAEPFQPAVDEPTVRPAANVDLSRGLSVALEGGCEGLDLSIVGREVFAHDDSGAIVRLTGDPPHALPMPGWIDDHGEFETNPVGTLAGRWPDRLYATYLADAIFQADGLMHLDGSRWVAVLGFGQEHTIWSLEPWTDDVMLARVFIPSGVPAPRQLRSVGTSDGPSTAALTRACGDDWDVRHPTRDRGGNLGMALACGGDEHFAIWPAGETTPVIHRLPIPFDFGPFGVVADAHGGFFTAYRSGRIVHIDRRGARVVPPPVRRGWVQHMASDPRGRLWVVMRDRVYRWGEGGWERQRVPGTTIIEELAGVEQGTPVMRRGGTYYWHGYRYREDGRVLARHEDGRWRTVPAPRSAFVPELRLVSDFLYSDESGHLWMLAHGRPGDRRSKDHPKYWAVVTTRPVEQAVRCPERLGA